MTCSSYEAPDDMTAASVAMAVAAAGEVRSAKTTRLLSGQEWLESLPNAGLPVPGKRASRTTPAPIAGTLIGLIAIEGAVGV